MPTISSRLIKQTKASKILPKSWKIFRELSTLYQFLQGILSKELKNCFQHNKELKSNDYFMPIILSLCLFLSWSFTKWKQIKKLCKSVLNCGLQSHVNLVDDKVLLDAFFDKLLLGNAIGETVFDSSPEIDWICLIKTVVDYFG